MEHRIPQCVGFILDGNRRWARARGMPTIMGHRRAFSVLEDVARWVRDRGIPHMVVYAFSTENWKRSPEEVAYLMDIFHDVIRHSIGKYSKENIRVRFIGERERFSEELQRGMQEAEEHTAECSRLTLWFALSYGGRAEIASAARAAVASGIALTEDSIGSCLWSAEMPAYQSECPRCHRQRFAKRSVSCQRCIGMPDPDLIVRTGGEQRLSNFLLWQAAYSELIFIPEHWPDFDEALLDRVLAEYSSRERRMGK